MSLSRVLLGFTAGTALATLVASAARSADAAGDELAPARPARKERPAVPAPPTTSAPPAAASSSAAPAAWSAPRAPRVTSGVIARAARIANGREPAAPPAPGERRRAGKARGERKIISLEIDWNAGTTAP